MRSDEVTRIEWKTRRLWATPQSETAVTVYECDSGVPGPNLLVLGGIHGDEVGGIVAAGRVATTKWMLQRGRITVVPVAHEAAHHANTRASPIDGVNLARAFPGLIAGSPTQQLAWLITDRLISHADALMDLHTSNSATDMPLFVGCIDDGTPHASRAVSLAVGVGIPLLWTHPSLGPGRTLTVAHERGIPALYVESPVGGVLDSAYVEAYTDGVRSVLEHLDMIEATDECGVPQLWLHGNGDTDTFCAATVSGLFLRAVNLMSEVRRGDLVGSILNSVGAIIVDVVSPADGYVTTLQRAAVVEPEQPIVGITPARPPKLGLPSDEIFSRPRST